MKLTNLHRRCLGLEEIDSNWDEVKLNDEKTIFFDGDVIRKLIVQRKDYYAEYSENIETTLNRTMIKPKTTRGKIKKLTPSSLDNINAVGTYFFLYDGDITIGNITTQKTYYSSRREGLKFLSVNDVNSFLEKWVKESNDTLLDDINEFKNEKRKNFKYKEGDVFRYKIDRTHYAYGRVLLNVDRLRKSKVKQWDDFMGKPVIVQVFHIITEDKSISIDSLKNIKTCPSQYIMDNNVFYGDYEIIGNIPLTDKEDYPIKYGYRAFGINSFNIAIQIGPLYKEIPTEEKKLIHTGFTMNGAGFEININKKILEECIKTNSNNPYWNQNDWIKQKDLRHPDNEQLLKKVLKQFDIVEL